MKRRQPTQALRGSDAMLLQVQLSDLLRLPVRQLSPENALDIVALAELDSRPKVLAKQLDGFVQRYNQEVTELPGVTAFDEFLDEIEAIAPERIPQTFREWLLREANRGDRPGTRIAALLDRLSETPSEPFDIGGRTHKVEHIAAGRAPRSRLGRREARPASDRPKRAKAAPRVSGPVHDVKRIQALQEICMERLHGASDSGLAQAVMVAGIRHRAGQSGLAGVTPAEVLKALRNLEQAGRVRQSAGRWMSARMW